jgi:glycosyltransferase involved in cell wall biosynthesis
VKKITLTIIGEGTEFENLKNLVKSFQLEAQVNFTGALKGNALVDCLNEHKYLLVPSLWEEPFGNVALEGLACGCIPIVSDGGGLPDAVGDAGLVFKRGDIDALTNVMLNVLLNPEIEQNLLRNASTHLKSHLPEVVAERYLKVIQESVKK